MRSICTHPDHITLLYVQQNLKNSVTAELHILNKVKLSHSVKVYIYRHIGIAMRKVIAVWLQSFTG